METANQTGSLVNYAYICVIASLLLCLCPTISNLDACEACGNFSHEEVAELESIDIKPEDLGEYAEMFREFQKSVENPDLSKREFFVWKWCKKVKRWFVKRMYHLFKEIVCIKKHKKKDYAAYAVAKFQRDLNKYHNTGAIKNIIQDVKKRCGEDPTVNTKMAPFFARVKHYAKHKHDRAKHPEHDRYDMQRRGSRHEGENLLAGVPLKAAFGGVECACGALIFVLPFPGCRWLGGTLALHGGEMIIEGCYEAFVDPKQRVVGAFPCSIPFKVPLNICKEVLYASSSRARNRSFGHDPYPAF